MKGQNSVKRIMESAITAGWEVFEAEKGTAIIGEKRYINILTDEGDSSFEVAASNERDFINKIGELADREFAVNESIAEVLTELYFLKDTGFSVF